MERSHRKRLAAFLPLLCVPALPGYAGELAFGIGYEGQYSNNVLQTAIDEREEWTNIYIAGFGYRELNSEIAADVQAQLKHRSYTRGLYQDETIGYLSSAALWSISPKRLVWSVIDRLDQLPQNSTVPVSSFFAHDAVNVFETGPDLLFPVTPASTLVLGARYRNVWFKLGDNDNSGAIAAVRIRHRLASTTEISLNAEGGKVEYTEAPTLPTSSLQNYRRADYYFRYDQRLVTTRLLLDLGATNIVSEDNQNEEKEPIYRLNLAQKVGSETTVGISYGRELMSIGTALLASVGDPSLKETIQTPTAIPYELASGAIFKSRHGDAFVTFAGTRIRSQTSLYYRDIDYLVAPDDRTEKGVYQTLALNLTPTLIFGMSGEAKRIEYPVNTAYPVGRLDRYINYSGSLTYKITPRLSLGIEGVHERRLSTDSSADYEETRGIVRLIYVTSPYLQMTETRGYGNVP